MEASGEFCLRWHNHQQNLRATMAEQYKNRIFTDVTLGVEDGHSIQCHKMILAASSRYFQSILIDFPYDHPIVVLNDVKYNQIIAILEYMYKGEVNVPGNELPALFKVAEALEIKGLVDENNRYAHPGVANRSVINTPEVRRTGVKFHEERALPSSPASSSYWFTEKCPVTSDNEKAKLFPSVWSTFSQAVDPEGHNSIASAPLQKSLSARYLPILGSHCDNRTEHFSRKKRTRKISSTSATINRGDPIPGKSLDRAQAGGSSPGDNAQVIHRESRYRIASDDPMKNDYAIDFHPTRSPDVNETWIVDEDEKRVSRRSSSEETNPGNGSGNTSSSKKPGAAKRYKQYTNTDIAGAIAAVLENGMSANKAAVMFRVPSRTLYDKISRAKKEEELRNSEAGTSKRKRNSISSGASLPYGISGGSATGKIYGNSPDTLTMEDSASVLETTLAESRDNFVERDAKVIVNVQSPTPRLPMDSQASYREESDNKAEDLSLRRKSDIAVVMPTRSFIKEAI